MTTIRSASRLLAPLALAVSLTLTACTSVSIAQAAKEPTDGFFDVPDREKSEDYGVPAYLVTSALGGLAIFILCRSARRS